MKRTSLVQRLHPPLRDADGKAHANPFSFGGGPPNGGIPDAVMALLVEVFSFDYMGSAEFEFGAVPEALQRIVDQAKADELMAWSFTIALRQVASHWKDKTKLHPSASAVIYVLSDKQNVEEIEKGIRLWASLGYRADLLQPLLLSNALRPHEEFDVSVCGWLELDNGFFFFTDPAMWEGTAKLFGVEEGHLDRVLDPS